MTVHEINKLHDKAKDRKDGIYSYNGNLWAVKNGQFIAYVNINGTVLQRFGAFDAVIGDLSSIERWERKKKFQEWFNKN